MSSFCLQSSINLFVHSENGVENSVVPDQTAPKEQSDLGLHCLLKPTCSCISVNHGNYTFRDSMSEEDKQMFWRNVQCTVEKDVIRTDRSHPYFRGENNPNIEVLK